MADNLSSKHKEITENIKDLKQRPKSPVKFQLTLNEEQKEAKDKILNKIYNI